MKILIKKILSYFSIELTIKNYKSKLLSMGLHGNYEELDKDQLLLKDFNLIVNRTEHEFMLLGFRLMKTLKEDHNAIYYFNQENKLLIEIEGLKYNIQTYEELFILNEIFSSGVYNIVIKEDFILFDVGMNVAMTSLFFAHKPNCIGVNSYEPFKKTYKQALYNILLNPTIKNKINTNNFGLGLGNYELNVHYDENIKGNMGINGIPKHLECQQQLTLETIQIHDALKTLKDTLEISNPKITKILKIDCEGAEYEIFNSIEHSNLLESFEIIIIEWHYKGPKNIIDSISNAGFKYFSFNEKSKSAGMIYAFKN